MWNKQKKQQDKREEARSREPHFFYRRRLRNYQKHSHRRLYYGLCLAGVALLTVAASYSATRIGLYLWQGVQSARVSSELRDLYRSEPTADPALSASQAAAPGDEAQESGSDAKLLPALTYPAADGALRKRFKALQRRNKDIVGWLSIEGLLDEAVVQRDNAYYLRRDYLGYHNVNGAIFLDEGCDLRSRPYTYILYGHNMRTQTMFGSLRRYDSAVFYRANPFITFDTSEESGRYVVFSVATISVDRRDRHFVDLNKLDSTTVMWREAAIAALRKRSRYSPVIEVAAQDQVLLLVTCKREDSDERRVVAARRIREGETEEELLRLLRHSYRQR